MIGAVLKIAMRALARNKGRSALTMLGIIIGVASVIAMVGLGQGAQKQVQQQIESMGTNMLIISAGSQRTGGVRGGAGTSTTLDAGRSRGDPARCPGGVGDQPERQRARDAGLRQSELDHARRRRRSVVSRDPQPVRRVGRVLHRRRCADGRACGGDRADRRARAVRRQRSRWAD